MAPPRAGHVAAEKSAYIRPAGHQGSLSYIKTKRGFAYGICKHGHFADMSLGQAICQQFSHLVHGTNGHKIQFTDAGVPLRWFACAPGAPAERVEDVYEDCFEQKYTACLHPELNGTAFALAAGKQWRRSRLSRAL